MSRALRLIAALACGILSAGLATRDADGTQRGCPTERPVAAAAAAARGSAWPAPLSRSRARASIDSPRGGGVFGRWSVDGAGLPAFAFNGDRPALARASIAGRAEGWHLIGNDHINALASTSGWVQLWSQDRRYQWVNRPDEAGGHHVGGFGYLRAAGRTYSTLTADAGREAGLVFGVDDVRRCRRAGAVSIDEHVYAPFGDEPVVLHDVALTNVASRPLRAAWSELWDVNPYDQGSHQPIGVGAPSFDTRRRVLTVRQEPGDDDTRPLTIFAAALRGPLAGFETNAARFFGQGSRAAPSGVAAARPASSRARPQGGTVLVFRAPVTIPAGGSVRLRYAFGAAHPAAIASIVRRYAGGADDPLAATRRAWAAWVPQLRGIGGPELAREAQWAAASVRAAATFEEACGHHVLSQGGAYQYGLGLQVALRDPLQHALAAVATDPPLALDVLRYAAALQDDRTAGLPYGVGGMCRIVPNVGSGDLDVWLLLLAAEYGLATRDEAALSTPVPFRGGGRASLWEHLRRAVEHQESLHGPHGGYRVLDGDWSDGSGGVLGMTESALIPAQLAYVYPRLAELARARGDDAFARRLDRLGRRAAAVVAAAWTPAGWVGRGWAGKRPLGRGVLFAEPQPWALLAGVATGTRAARLVGAIRSELTGPSRIGTPQSPASADPRVTERSRTAPGAGDGAAAWTGGVWYAVDGWLTWALARSDGAVPGARAMALDELRRTTLAAHAEAYPRAWSGILSIDDACAAYYAAHPDRCGIGASREIDTLNLTQPSWLTWNLLALAGIEPIQRGYRFAPHVPGGHFALRMPLAGIEAAGPRLRGYVRPRGAGPIQLEVRAPGSRRVSVLVDGRQVAHRRRRGAIVFSARARGSSRPVDWAVGPADTS